MDSSWDKRDGGDGIGISLRDSPKPRPDLHLVIQGSAGKNLGLGSWDRTWTPATGRPGRVVVFEILLFTRNKKLETRNYS